MKIQWNNKNIPVLTVCDIAVIGAGPGGLGAAVISARTGRDVAVLEQAGRPGGAAANCEVSPFMLSGSPEKFFDAPVFTDWLKRIIGYLPEGSRKRQQSAEIGDSSGRLITPALAALAAEDMLLEAGARLFYHFTLADVILSDDRKRI